MAWLQILILAAVVSTSQAQPACPAGLVTTASTTITTNDVILIKAPLLDYTDAASACTCLPGGYTAANASEFFNSHPQDYIQTAEAYSGVSDLITDNLGNPTIVWFGPTTSAGTYGCPAFEVSTAISTDSVDCQQQFGIVCSRSLKVYNPLGSACDNDLQLCQQGTYCNPASNTCETDTICFPTNPCTTGLGPSDDKSNVVCTVTPGAPGGYTCQCGLVQAATTLPGPQTCVQCPSANPCAITPCPQGTSCGFTCGAGPAYCAYPNGTRVPSTGSNPPPPVTPPSSSGVCGSGENQGFPVQCYFNSDPLGRYVCCDSAGCDGFNPPDFLFPHCAQTGHVPAGYGVNADNNPVPPPVTPPTPTPPSPSGSQGVCGSGDAQGFPVRCYFNSDPEGRYVCCDAAGCDGFNPPDFSFPHCSADGFVPPGFGVNAPAPVPNPPPAESGSQGVCGTGDAAAYPERCYFNSDPQGRYVCCDSAGCDGFSAPDNVFPHCAANGFVPSGFGV